MVQRFITLLADRRWFAVGARRITWIDTFEQDPISHFRSFGPTLPGRRLVGQIDLPSVFVLEGGYVTARTRLQRRRRADGFERAMGDQVAMDASAASRRSFSSGSRSTRSPSPAKGGSILAAEFEIPSSVEPPGAGTRSCFAGGPPTMLLQGYNPATLGMIRSIFGWYASMLDGSQSPGLSDSIDSKGQKVLSISG